MADQDFNIKVVTTADTTGIRQTSVELDKLKQQQATFAETARRQAAASAAAATATKPTETTAGFTGTAIGLSTIIALVTGAIGKWKEFNDAQTKEVETMVKAAEKSRELGLAVADMLDAMKSSERIETEPLQVSFDRLKEKVTELKTEMQIAFAAGQYEDVKRYAAALGVVESQVHRVTSALQQQAKAKEQAAAKDREDKERFEASALSTSSDRTQEILQNEELAKKARAAGRFDKASTLDVGTDYLKSTATGIELEEYKQLKAARDARDREFQPKPQGQAQPSAAPTSSPDVVQAIRNLEDKFDRYWS